MQKLKVEKGIPIPRAQTGKPLKEEYPFELLELGDSFAIPYPSVGKEQLVRSLRAQAYYWGKKFDRKFLIRALPSEVRTWRVYKL